MVLANACNLSIQIGTSLKNGCYDMMSWYLAVFVQFFCHTQGVRKSDISHFEFRFFISGLIHFFLKFSSWSTHSLHWPRNGFHSSINCRRFSTTSWFASSIRATCSNSHNLTLSGRVFSIDSFCSYVRKPEAWGLDETERIYYSELCT